ARPRSATGSPARPWPGSVATRAGAARPADSPWTDTARPNADPAWPRAAPTHTVIVGGGTQRIRPPAVRPVGVPARWLLGEGRRHRSTTRRLRFWRYSTTSPPGAGPTPASTPSAWNSHIDVRPLQAYDPAKQAMGVESDRPHALREAIMACANGGVVSVIGVYGGFVDKFPMGSIMNRSLTLRAGQCHVHRYMEPLMKRPWCRASTSASSPRRRHRCTVLPQFPERCSAMLR
ncbi:MAG TPA: hypothetical protein VF734_18105, partial [Pseudonocardiaceae bacterium]